jgi:hypothetical protein
MSPQIGLVLLAILAIALARFAWDCWRTRHWPDQLADPTRLLPHERPQAADFPPLHGPSCLCPACIDQTIRAWESQFPPAFRIDKRDMEDYS